MQSTLLATLVIGLDAAGSFGREADTNSADGLVRGDRGRFLVDTILDPPLTVTISASAIALILRHLRYRV